MKNKLILHYIFDSGKISCLKNGDIVSKRNIVLKGTIRNGYKCHILSTNGRKYGFYAHQIVYLYFNRDADFTNKVINHINFKRSDNKIENLELVTVKQNVNHSAKHGRIKGKLEFNCNLTKLTSKQVLEIRKKHSGRRSTKPIALEYGISTENVRDIIKRNTWKHI